MRKTFLTSLVWSIARFLCDSWAATCTPAETQCCIHVYFFSVEVGAGWIFRTERQIWATVTAKPRSGSIRSPSL